ncbi:MAG: iron-sulfur cluster assembly protein [Armatimonadota bacterium]|nr:iron-sulfur cluster assembly protein [Armatimonadota bacterium]
MKSAPPTEEVVRQALKECYDPEIPVNIVDLGLVYHVCVHPGGRVEVEMTLTNVGCPEAERLLEQVRERVRQLPGVTECGVTLCWDPPWNPTMMTEEGRVLGKILGLW